MKHIFTLKILVLLLLLGAMAPLTTNAQLTPTPALMAQINAELHKRGLSEGEVQVRLIQEGIDLQNIPVDQLPNYKDRVMAILDKMQAEKTAKNGVLPQVAIAPAPSVPANIVSTQGGAVQTVGVTPVQTILPNNVVVMDSTAKAVNQTTQPITTPQEAAAEAAQKVIQKAESKTGGGSNIYGHSLFSDKSLDVFRTSDGAQAPETYVLGEGDEIRITIFGASQTDIQQKINQDGYIQPVGTSKIYLKGLTLAQSREVIQQRLSLAYTFRTDQFAVTVVTARTILVNIFGEAKMTGGFSISALNSAFNALSAAGGPSAIGSVRAIQQIRGNNKKTLDLYAFMSDPTVQYKFDLQQNDILYVPVAQELVQIEGAVKRPMSYEMLPSETLADLIKYAGGINVNTFPDFVQIERVSNGEVRLQEYNLGDVLSGKVKVPIQNGDIVRTRENNKPIEQYVDITGSLYYPGRFDLAANPTLDVLIKNAQPTPQAKMDLVFVERTRKDLTVEQISVNMLNLKDSNKTFKLYPRDKVSVSAITTFTDIANISVSGHVRAPFEKSFAVNDHITVKQAIDMAGGLKIDAYPIAYVVRYNVYNPKEKKYLRLDLAGSDNFKLQAGDELIIFDKNKFTETASISVAGFVRNPIEKTFAYTDRISLKDALDFAGGAKPGASNIAYIFRSDLLFPQKKQYIRVDLDKIKDIMLQPGDQLNVYDGSMYLNNGDVQISGSVKSPMSFTYDNSLTVPDIFRAAGGVTVGAAFNRVEVFRTTISPKEHVQLSKFTLEVDSAYHVVKPSGFSLQPYDHIVIRQTPAFSMGRFVELTGEVVYPGIYQLKTEQTSLSDIIQQAGGLLPTADAIGSSLFRTYKNRGSVTINVKQAVQHSGSKKLDPILFEGDVININRLENTVTIRETGTRMTQYAISPSGGALKVMVYQGSKSAKWYITHYAGGFTKEANKNSVTVTLANGQMFATRKSFIFFRHYPLVKPGSVIAMQLDPPEIPTVESKSKMDWQSFWATTLSATTALLSIIILSKQL
jgi:protein involved in polysaccharide export with SLBB domain